MLIQYGIRPLLRNSKREFKLIQDRFEFFSSSFIIKT
jgi:hypothetical protein